MRRFLRPSPLCSAKNLGGEKGIPFSFERDSLIYVDVVLLHVVDYLHELLAEIVGQFHGLGLAVDADDRLGVRLAEVYPTVGEVDLHTVDIIFLLLDLMLFYCMS